MPNFNKGDLVYLKPDRVSTESLPFDFGIILTYLDPEESQGEGFCEIFWLSDRAIFTAHEEDLQLVAYALRE